MIALEIDFAALERHVMREHAGAKMCAQLAEGGMNPMRGRRFSYNDREWSRLEAWQHLTQQQIPGAPMFSANRSRTPWRKAHSIARGEWAWVYVG